MKQIKLIFVILFAFVLSNKIFAVEAKLLYENKLSILSIADLRPPGDLLTSQLDSGLPNNISIVIRIYNNQEIVNKFIVNSVVVYDLWDEVYNLQTIHFDKIIYRKYTSKLELINDLRQIRLVINAQSTIKHSVNSELRISLQTIYNPVNEQQIRKIKDWIMSSKGHSQSGDFHVALENQGEPTLPPSNGLRFQKLFEKIVEDYAPDEGFSAQWKSQLETIDIEQLSSINEN